MTELTTMGKPTIQLATGTTHRDSTCNCAAVAQFIGHALNRAAPKVHAAVGKGAFDVASCTTREIKVEYSKAAYDFAVARDGDYLVDWGAGDLSVYSASDYARLFATPNNDQQRGPVAL